MALASALALLVLASVPAQASFPAPNNGKVVFSKFVENADGTRNYEIFAKIPYGTEVEQLTTDDRTDEGPVYSPDGEKIAWISEAYSGLLAGQEQVWVMNADGSGKMRLDTGKLYHERNLAFSPDGDEVGFTCALQYAGYERDICTAKIDGSGFTNLTNTPLKIEHSFTWSPSGEWLAFVSDQCPPRGCGKGEMGPNRVSSATFKVRADGSSLTRLIPDRPDTYLSDEELTWSPDGTRIAFVRYVDPPIGQYVWSAIFTMRPDGSGLSRLTKVYGYERGPAWSPDGAQLVHSYYAPGDGGWVGGLRKIRADGTNEVHLSEHHRDADPLWAPNGKRIAFDHVTFPPGEGTHSNIYTMKPDGSDKRLVVRDPYFGGSFDWQPRP